MLSKTDQKTQKAWAFYDWANSVYALVISTAIFPMFFNAVTSSGEGTDLSYEVVFFGRNFVNTELYSYVMALSFIVVIFLSPILSGIADATGKKKSFLRGFCYLGAAACASMYFFDVEHLEWSMLSVLLASIGYWSSIVFYNAYLPEIAEPKDHDRLSARGYSLGYIGSVILLIINLVMIMVIGDELVRWCFVLVAVWWAGFAQVTLRKLPSNPYNRKTSDKVLSKGITELKSAYRQALKIPVLIRYLIAFFVFSMAVQTIMLMAQFFGMKEVTQVIGGVLTTGLTETQFIVAIILVQVIAIPGAFLFSRSSGKLGNIPTLIVALICWIAVCLFAYFVVDTPNEFYVAAGCIGFMMGGTQSMSRSTYSKILPETKDHASFFSLYDVLEKLGIVIGMLCFGYIEGITGSMRNSILSLVFFFVIGLVLLFYAKAAKPATAT
jgi:MFS transporter, UMF1 family